MVDCIKTGCKNPVSRYTEVVYGKDVKSEIIIARENMSTTDTVSWYYKLPETHPAREAIDSLYFQRKMTQSLADFWKGIRDEYVSEDGYHTGLTQKVGTETDYSYAYSCDAHHPKPSELRPDGYKVLETKRNKIGS
jgi:hypothetical protein